MSEREPENPPAPDTHTLPPRLTTCTSCTVCISPPPVSQGVFDKITQQSVQDGRRHLLIVIPPGDGEGGGVGEGMIILPKKTQFGGGATPVELSAPPQQHGEQRSHRRLPSLTAGAGFLRVTAETNTASEFRLAGVRVFLF